MLEYSLVICHARKCGCGDAAGRHCYCYHHHHSSLPNNFHPVQPLKHSWYAIYSFFLSRSLGVAVCSLDARFQKCVVLGLAGDAQESNGRSKALSLSNCVVVSWILSSCDGRYFSKLCGRKQRKIVDERAFAVALCTTAVPCLDFHSPQK
jgi:hypothetical protein